jgi:hypothetical protein
MSPRDEELLRSIIRAGAQHRLAEVRALWEVAAKLVGEPIEEHDERPSKGSSTERTRAFRERSRERSGTPGNAIGNASGTRSGNAVPSVPPPGPPREESLSLSVVIENTEIENAREGTPGNATGTLGNGNGNAAHGNAFPDVPKTIDRSLPLSEESRAYAEQLGVQDIDVEWATFVSWHKAKGVLAVDFYELWRAWVPKTRSRQRTERERAAQAQQRGKPWQPPPDPNSPEELKRKREERAAWRDKELARLEAESKKGAANG